MAGPQQGHGATAPFCFTERRVATDNEPRAATPHSSLDNAVYDPGSRMLFRFLNGVTDHLEPGGEAWLWRLVPRTT